MEQLAKILIAKNLTLSTAESCTGGALSAKLTSVSGSSAYFDCGLITYSNQAKMNLLTVQQNTLNNFGAVSEPIVKEMVLGLIEKSNTNIGVSISGIAGPDGGSVEKPVGTVCFGFYINKKTQTTTEHFSGNRGDIVIKSVDYVINFLKAQI
jgi:nicotinamide-nucleotide amidase